ncbi:MAG TPA: hypothetical protein VNO26_06240 [Candidatus Limnocylindria bacterium]|nr:hypothetical protein [Candidatus Limnocylindria bacterium]
MTAFRERWPGAAGAIGLGCLALVLLHLLEPAGSATWAYAHLDRHPALPWLAAASVVVLPAAAAWAWQRPWIQAPVGRFGVARAAAVVGAATVAVAGVGAAWPVTPICIDSWYFATAVGDGVSGNPRWYLTLWSFSELSQLARPLVTPLAFVRLMNGVVSAWALAALAAAARTLGRTRGEAIAIAALCWTAFGVLQLAFGYVDVYPTALCLLAVYLWLGSGVLVGNRHPVWATVVAAIAPFFYVGLVLLAPSCLVLLWVSGRRRGWRVVAEAGGAALLAAGAATVPGYGMPFAWAALARDLAPALQPGAPVDGRGALLPQSEIVSARHWIGLLHLLLLTDAVGVLLLLACGGAAVRRLPSAESLWLAALLVPSLAYLATMDALFGLYADWDLFSYLAAITALAGAYAFVVWARAAPRIAGPLLGLALAAATVHLMARLNGLDIDFHRHLAETPFRIPVAGAPSVAR